jgi:hypothetical protein
LPTGAEHDRAVAALAPLGAGLYARLEPRPPPPDTRTLTVLAIVAGIIAIVGHP